MLLDHLDERSDRSVVLGIDVDAQVGERPEKLLEQRDGLASADPRGAHDLPRQLGDVALVVGDPIEDVVVEGKEHAVGGHVHVGLDVAVAEADRALERRHRVLGPLARAAAVGERDRTGMIEERELHH